MQNDTVKKALITGGNRGVGKGIVLALAENGYDIAFTYWPATVEAEEAQHVKNLVENKWRRRCFAYPAAFEKAQTAQTVVQQAARDLQGLDVLVNNAATKKETGYLYDANPEVIDEYIAVNFRANILTMREAARYMMLHETHGCILNITSHRACRTYPGDGIYGSIKAGISRLSESLALEVAPYGIRVNCIAPGAIDIRSKEEYLLEGATPEEIEDRELLGKKVPLGRLGTPADVGNAVVWLASEAASYITGVSLRVDGALFLPGMPETRLAPGEEDRGWGHIALKSIEQMRREWLKR